MSGPFSFFCAPKLSRSDAEVLPADRQLETRSSVGSSLRKANHLGAQDISMPPDNSIFAVWPITGDEEHEFVGNVISKRIKPHAAVGKLDGEAVARRAALRVFNFCETFDRFARCRASFLRNHWANVARPQRRGAVFPKEAKAPSVDYLSNGTCMQPKAHTRIFFAFS
jgi:hypothetical protein